MRPIYIFDLDGTLADIEHRLHHIQGQKKDWRAFFAACVDDKPIEPVIRTFKALRKGGAEIWIWSGRSDEVMNETADWLRRHGLFSNLPVWIPRRAPESLRMRKAGDHRNDDVLKYEWLSEIEPPEYARLAGVFEDRTRVVEMWRRAGIPCFQVAQGDF